MKEYEQKIHNIINNAEEDVIFQAHQAYEQGYATGYDHGKRDGYADGKADTPFTDTEEAEKKAYNRGLDDAWDIAKKIMRMDIVEKDAVFAEFGRATSSVILDLSASEVIQKIKAYEDKQKRDAEIKVGDEVKTISDAKGVVITNETDVKGNISVLFKTCSHVQLYPKNKLTRTGKHYPQIAEVLKEMRGAENDE